MKSEQINELMAALSKCQGMMENPKKNKKVVVKNKETGAEYTYWYADLPSIMDTIRKPSLETGLAVYHDIDWDGANPIMVSTLGHTSGQYIQAKMRIMVNIDPKKNLMQQWASGVSFAKRYNITNLYSMAAEDDDDGESSDPKGNDVSYSSKEPTVDKETGLVEPPKPKWSEKQLKAIHWWANTPVFVKRFYGSFSISEDMTKKEFDEVMKYSQELKAKKDEYERAKGE